MMHISIPRLQWVNPTHAELFGKVTQSSFFKCWILLKEHEFVVGFYIWFISTGPQWDWLVERRLLSKLYTTNPLTPWGRVMHICVSKLTITGSDNGLLPGQHQAIIWTNAAILLIKPLATNFNEILIEIHTFSFKKMCLKVSSAKWRPFCLGFNPLIMQVHGASQQTTWKEKNNGIAENKESRNSL